MILQKEWIQRLDLWRRTLGSQVVVKVGTVELQGFVTREQLSFRQASAGKFKPMPSGTSWGGKWEYGWFRTTVVAPAAAAGRRLVFHSGADAECLIFVNGVERGANSWAREEITLTRKAKTGEKFEILIEAYAGHGKALHDVGPLIDNACALPEPPATQKKIGATWIGVWDEEAFQLLIDVETLFSLRQRDLDQNSLRVQQIDAGLRDFTTIVDFEVPYAQRRASYVQARRRLAPLLKCRNGSTAPDMFAFGHGHLDIEWLWPLAESRRKIARTLSSQLELAAEYPAYRFMQSQAQLFWMLKQDYPALYRRVKAAVRAGSIIAEGGMWVEPDMNLTGGESLIRQCLHGKRFFKEEFGVDSTLLWLPDVFGYSAALPQILLGCGIKYFSTTKIFWSYYGGQPFPYNTFMWEGIDGSRVLSHLFSIYGGTGYPKEPIMRWRERVQKEDISSMMYCFGYGDGGGGATREQIETVIRMRDLEGCPRVRLSGPVEFFKDLEKRGIPAETYVGELYFQAHRGCLTTQAATKKGNRKCEYTLREAELWGCAAAALAGFKFSASELADAWRGVLLKQFHDVLPGSSIERVYQETAKVHAAAAEKAATVAAKAVSRLAGGAKGATVFNSLGWERSVLATLPAGMKGAVDAEGTPLVTQTVQGATLAEVRVPSCGWTSLQAGRPVSVESGIRVDSRVIENELLKVRLNDKGEISSVVDRQTGVELIAGPCNSMKMFKDIPGKCDAWDLDTSAERLPVELKGRAEFKVLAAGPLVGRLMISRKLNNSMLTQVLSLRRNSRRLEFETTIDWKETHKLLKVAFPVNIHSPEAVHEIQFGHLRRPTHRSMPFDADRYEVAAHKWTALCEEGRGFAVLNDCKYGVSVLGNCISLSLLRSTKAPDPNADQGKHGFTYGMYFWTGSLAESGVVREGYELNVPARCVPGDGGERSLFAVSAPDVVIETVKPAEDGSGDIAVRLYEAMRTATVCTLSTDLPVESCHETDMLENRKKKLLLKKGVTTLNFRPFEIKTLVFRMKK